jgi:hypothetical protein
LHFRVFIRRPGRHFVEAAYAVNNLWLNRDQGGVSEAVAAAARQDTDESRSNALIAINPSRLRFSVPELLGGSHYARFASL